jgi:hypothetical protein
MGVMVILFLLMAFTSQDDAAANEAVATFDAGFSKTKDASMRAGFVSNLAKTHHEKVVARLGSLLTHEDKGVKIAAAQALSGFQSTSEDLKKSASHVLGSALTAGANVRDEDVMGALFSALGNLQEESSASVLKNHFEDRNGKIAAAAVGAAGPLKSKTLIEPLISLMRECEKTMGSGSGAASGGGGSASGKGVKAPKTTKGGGGGGGGSSSPDPEAAKKERANTLIPACQAALQLLTGQALSGSDEWEKWWSKNRATFTISK